MKDLYFLTNKLIAHRGFHNGKDIPENSIKAFEKAIENGYSIELDVHLLKDGKIIVFHDDNLKRLTGVDKIVKDCTYEEIKEIKLLETNEKIPLFDDILQLVDGKVPILIELKYDLKPGLLEKELVKLLDLYEGKYAVQSFNPFSVYWFRKNKPNIIRGQLSSDLNKSYFSVIGKFLLTNIGFLFTKPDFISYSIHSDIEKIKCKKSKKVKLLGWTVKNKTEYEKNVKICDNLICENFNFID